MQRVNSQREKLNFPRRLAGNAWCYEYAGEMRRPHRHEELEVNLIVRGRASYLTMGRKYDLRPGAQIFLFPDQDHVLLDESRDFVMWILVWRPGLVRRICTTPRNQDLRRRLPRQGVSIKRLGPAAADKLGALFADIAAPQMTQDLDRHEAALAYALLACWAEHQAADALDADGRALHPAVKEAARLLRDAAELNAEQHPPTLDELAAAAGLSPSRLSRLFKAEAGVSLVQFRQRMQFERFLALYDGGRTMKLLPAALTAGFGSYAQFYRVHKRFTGAAPRSEIRNRRRFDSPQRAQRSQRTAGEYEE